MGRKSLPEVPMRELVRAVAGPRMDVDTRESWLRRAARLAGTSFRQAKALYYGEINDPYHRTVAKFREAAGRAEAKNLASEFERLAISLGISDADFHSETIVALRNAAGALRGLDRPRNDGER